MPPDVKCKLIDTLCSYSEDEIFTKYKELNSAWKTYCKPTPNLPISIYISYQKEVSYLEQTKDYLIQKLKLYNFNLVSANKLVSDSDLKEKDIIINLFYYTDLASLMNIQTSSSLIYRQNTIRKKVFSYLILVSPINRPNAIQSLTEKQIKDSCPDCLFDQWSVLFCSIDFAIKQCTFITDEESEYNQNVVSKMRSNILNWNETR